MREKGGEDGYSSGGEVWFEGGDVWCKDFFGGEKGFFI